MESSGRNWERPPTKNNLSIYNIIQLIAMILVLFVTGKDFFTKFDSFSFYNFIKFLINVLVLVGLVLSGYGLFKDKMDSMKTGFILLFFGLIGKIVFSLINIIKVFKISSLFELILYLVLAYVIYVQTPHI